MFSGVPDPAADGKEVPGSGSALQPACVLGRHSQPGPAVPGCLAAEGQPGARASLYLPVYGTTNHLLRSTG